MPQTSRGTMNVGYQMSQALVLWRTSRRHLDTRHNTAKGLTVTMTQALQGTWCTEGMTMITTLLDTCLIKLVMRMMTTTMILLLSQMHVTTMQCLQSRFYLCCSWALRLCTETRINIKIGLIVFKCQKTCWQHTGVIHKQLFKFSISLFIWIVVMLTV